MITLLSPAKTLDLEPSAISLRATKPRLLEKSLELNNELSALSKGKLQKLMSVSHKLTDQVHGYVHDFSVPFTSANAKPAMLVFKGDVYKPFDFDQYSKSDFAVLQKKVRILSGLYGLLRPLDLMQAYRLEMSTRLKNPKGKNLYDFWGSDITQLLNKDIKKNKASFVVNLASEEYFKAIKPDALKAPLLKVSFKEKKGEDYRVIGLFAKRARGMMADYIVKNDLSKLDELKSFNRDDYKYNADFSTAEELVFTRG